MMNACCDTCNAYIEPHNVITTCKAHFLIIKTKYYDRLLIYLKQKVIFFFEKFNSVIEF